MRQLKAIVAVEVVGPAGSPEPNPRNERSDGTDGIENLRDPAT